MPPTVQSMNSLKGKSRTTLRRLAVEAGVPLGKICEAATCDELRRVIIDAEIDRALGEERR